MTLPDLPIILLAAGASSRMRGRDKLMEEIDGTPLIRRQGEMVRAATTGPVIIALPLPPHPRYKTLTDMEVLCLPIPDASEGMGASIRTAFAALPPATPHAMLCLADLPDLTTPDLIAVAQAAENDKTNLIWRGATPDGTPGHPIVFDHTLFPKLVQLEGDSGGREVVKAASDRTVLVPLQDDRARHDLDTPEAWTAWRANRP